jgi:hypothetical protein
MTYVSIHHSQLPWLTPGLQHALKLFDRYRNPWTGVIEHEIPDGALVVLHTRYPELDNHRRRYPIDTTAQPRMISIPIGPAPAIGQVFATSKR